MPKKIPEFAAFLREKISNARIREISQVENERIIEIKLEKDKKYSLIVELFGGGNVILCRQDIILAAMQLHKWKDRTIKQGQKYIFPERKFNIFSRESLAKAAANSDEAISKILAVKMGIGRVYAEEICLRAEINKLSKKISKEETEKIYSEVQKLANRPLNPKIIYENDQALDIVPIELKIYSKKQQKEYKSYNAALAAILDKQKETERKTKAMRKFTGKLEQIDTKIQKQKETLLKLEREAEESQKKGELIYQHYTELKEKIAKTGSHQKIKLDIK